MKTPFDLLRLSIDGTLSPERTVSIASEIPVGVLHLEDDPEILEYYERLYEDQPILHFPARHPVEATRILEECNEQIGFVIIDLNLGTGVSGEEWIYKNLDMLQGKTIFAVSGYGSRHVNDPSRFHDIVDDFFLKGEPGAERIWELPLIHIRTNIAARMNIDFAQDQIFQETSTTGSQVQIFPSGILPRMQKARFLPRKEAQAIWQDPRLIRALSPREFELLTADVLSSLGYTDIMVTPRSGDGGMDVYARKELDGMSLIFGFECKQYSESRKIGIGTMRSLLGSISQRSSNVAIGVLITTSFFTSKALEFIEKEARIRGRDFDGVIEWLRASSLKH